MNAPDELEEESGRDGDAAFRARQDLLFLHLKLPPTPSPKHPSKASPLTPNSPTPAYTVSIMSPTVATRHSAHRDSRRHSLSALLTSSAAPSDSENAFHVAAIAVPNKSKRSKRAHSSSSLSPSKKSSPSQPVKDAASHRTKKALTSRKAPSAKAIEVDVPVPVLMDATEAYTGFAYRCASFLLYRSLLFMIMLTMAFASYNSGVHSQLPPVFAENTVPAIADLFFDSFV